MATGGPRYIPCKTHDGGTPLVPHIYGSIQPWCTSEVQDQKNRARRFVIYDASTPNSIV